MNRPTIISSIFVFIFGLAIGILALFFIVQDTLRTGTMFNPDNFESINVKLIGTVDAISEKSVTVNRQGVKFDIQKGENTLVLIPGEEAGINTEIPEERLTLKEGEWKDISIGEKIEALTVLEENTFKAIRITLIPSSD
jgi:hypothetical protein